MSSASPPSRDIVDRYSRRKIPRIPNDQQKLLEESNSWASELRNRPHALAHVPGHVLETAKEAYASRARNATNSSRPKRKTRSPSASPSRKRMREEDIPNTQGSGTPISSWSPSPERNILPVQRAQVQDEVVQSSIVLETPLGARPPKSPLLVCPSSDAPEEDLEMEHPQALDQNNVMTSVTRKLAHLQPTVDSPSSSAHHAMATPPCAQPSLPSQPATSGTEVNGDKTTNHGHTERQDQDRVRFKSIPFDHSGKKIQQPPNRLAATKTFAPAYSSMPTSSSSVVVATVNGSSTQESIIRSIEGDEGEKEPTIITATAQSVIERVVEEEDSSSDDELVSTPAQRKLTISAQKESKARTLPTWSPRVVPATTQSGLIPHIVNNKSDLKPYEIFKRHYARYQDSNVDFVKACLCLRYLRDRKQLRECLFDEFIGIFGKYMEYVQGSDPGQATLVALEWFNIQQPDPNFTRRVVGCNDLEEILSSYPEEVAEVTRMIVDRSGSISGESSVDSEYRHGQTKPTKAGKAKTADRPEQVILDGAMDLDEVIYGSSAAGPSHELTQIRATQHEARKRPHQQVAQRPPPPSAERPLPRLSHKPPSSMSTKLTKTRSTPYSSRPTAILTQAPPPPSPRIPDSTAAIPKSTAVIPATIRTPGTTLRPPPRSQYSARLGSSSSSKPRPAMRTAEDRERLREHFKKRKSMERNSVASSSRIG